MYTLCLLNVWCPSINKCISVNKCMCTHACLPPLPGDVRIEVGNGNVVEVALVGVIASVAAELLADGRGLGTGVSPNWDVGDTTSVALVVVTMSMWKVLEGGAKRGAFGVVVTDGAIAALAPLVASFKGGARRSGVLREVAAPEAAAWTT